MIEFDEKGKATAEKSARAVEQSYSATADNMRDYSLKIIDMAHANTEAVFEFARRLASAKAPSDLATVWTAHARKQFEMLSGADQRAGSVRAEDDPRKRRADRAQRQTGI